MNPAPNDDDFYWFERLDASYERNFSEAEQQRAIEYFQAAEKLPRYLLEPTEYFKIKFLPKSCWENILKVLLKWFETEPEVRQYFCQFIDDPNWPGYKYAYDILLLHQNKSLPAIEETISKNQNNRDLVENLEELKDEINQSSPSKS